MISDVSPGPVLPLVVDGKVLTLTSFLLQEHVRLSGHGTRPVAEVTNTFRVDMSFLCGTISPMTGQ